MQIKEIEFSSTNFDRGCGEFVAKSINNEGALTLHECQMTKLGYEAFSIELGNKQVIKC